MTNRRLSTLASNESDTFQDWAYQEWTVDTCFDTIRILSSSNLIRSWRSEMPVQRYLARPIDPQKAIPDSRYRYARSMQTADYNTHLEQVHREK